MITSQKQDTKIFGVYYVHIYEQLHLIFSIHAKTNNEVLAMWHTSHSSSVTCCLCCLYDSLYQPTNTLNKIQ